MMRGKGSPYEVRCSRCDVSFPVETRRCIHCGGPTVASDSAPVGVDPGSSFPWSRPQPDSSTAPTREAAAPVGVGPGPASELPEEAPPSVASSLLRTFGSLFWVIALVGFSILRSCSEG